MKLRLSHNAMRFRLSVSEALRLKEQGRVSDALELPRGQRFDYVLLTDGSESPIQVEWGGAQLEIRLPTAMTQAFLASSDESWSHAIATDSGVLTVRIEKDLPCAHGDEPNPQADRFNSKQFGV